MSYMQSRAKWFGFSAILFFLVSCAQLNPPLTQSPQLNHSIKKSQLRFVVGLEEPLVATKETLTEENRAIGQAIANFRENGTAEPFEDYIRQFPDSGWNMSIQTNLGLIYYREGYFSKALKAWHDAWENGRYATERRARALTDRAVGEYARMHARLGHKEELETLFVDLGERAVSGPATELITGAREALWMFENDPGISFLCGPKALKNLLISLNQSPDAIAYIDEQRSEPGGYSFSEVSALADKVSFKHRLVYRSTEEPIPVPSVVNWKLSHYAVILEQQGDRYRVKDPTFASGDTWVSRDAIDEESSGYFLIPDDLAKDHDWQIASLKDAQEIYGMGQTTSNEAGANTPSDCNVGMCASNAKAMLVSLSLSDTPLVYAPPIGPSPQITLSYHQRESTQPSNFSFFNVSPKWTINMLSWIQDYPNSGYEGRSVLRYVAGGGAVNYAISAAYNSTTGKFTPERQDQAVLVRIPAAGTLEAYELHNPDGSKQIFSLQDGSTTYPRRVFLTQIIDAAGNALSLEYDDDLRLSKLLDATGRETVFDYENTYDPLLITKITDPFGRSAVLKYNDNGQLESITDIIGITSSFTYDSSGLVNSMSTPYGTENYAYGSGSSNYRYLERTDAMGFSDRLEFKHRASGMAYSENPIPETSVDNRYLYYRNTFYWDKNIYPTTHTDYTKAWLTHWLHNSAGQTSSIIESTKAPLERRVWRQYANQPVGYYEGPLGKPNIISRVLDDGETQAFGYLYNDIGKPTLTADPLGRFTRITYAENKIDPLTIELQTSSNVYEVVASFTYNEQHLPLTYTDAAGQTWAFTYNDAGQITTQTNPLGQVTTYAYDSLGYLQSVTNANGAVSASYSYDNYGRVETVADSEGYVTGYEYDDFDRVTKITYPDETTRLYTYDRLDLATYTDRLGRTTNYIYDANRRLVSVTDPQGLLTSYGYYPGGQLKTLTDPEGNVTTWVRDLQSRVTQKVYANGDTTTYAYEDTTSRLKSITDALGQVKTFTYNVDNNVAAINYTNTQNDTPSVSYEWDPYVARITSMSDGNGTTSYTYYPVGENGALSLSGEDGPYENDNLAYEYDVLGRIVGQSIGAQSENFVYDLLGRLTGTTNALGSFTYDYLGETAQMSGQTLSGSPVSSQFDYEENIGDRRLKGITNYGLARSFEFSTRPENLIDQIIETTGSSEKSWDYGYDAINRLTSASSSLNQEFAYDYDGADNITDFTNSGQTTTYSYNNANQIDESDFIYDANGNLLEDTERTYLWDAENRLINIAYKATEGRSTQFRYDGNGMRIAIIETTGDTSTETRLGWCGSSLCQARDSDDTVTRLYYPEGEVWAQNGVKLLYATDQIGSVRDVLLSTNGARLAASDYDPYGNTLSSTGRFSVDFGYAGMYYHKGSGLYLTQYRIYDPNTARWLTRDPIEEDGGLNLYGYVNGRPIVSYDRNGEYAQLALGFGIRFLGGRALNAAFASSLEHALGATAGGIVLCVLSGQCSLSNSNDGDKESPQCPIPDASPGPKTKGKSEIFDKPGGLDQANEDFDSLGPTDVEDFTTSTGEQGRKGNLSNGDKIVVRPNSSDGRPTVEIQSGKKKIKVRYY